MTKLINLAIEETSGVDHPAHLREGWMVMKSTAADVNATLDEIKAAAGSPNPQENRMSDEITEVVADPAELAKANERIAELEAALAATGDAVAPAEDDLMKSVPEPVRKMIAEQQEAVVKAKAEAIEATEALRKARDEQADKDAIAKAAGWSSLSMDATKVGPALRRLAETDGDLAKAVESVLEAANAQAESAGIFAEIGKAARPDSGDAYGKITTLAKAKVEAGQAPTFEQAFTSVVGENPDLYTQHLSEKGS